MDSFPQSRTMLLFVIFILVVSSLFIKPNVAQTTPPAFFIFGDSLADVGNNNHLPLSLLRADFSPNGIDYQNHTATGRFCNGRIVLDIVAQRMGFPVPLPYLASSTKGKTILEGVNYASGGCGILNETSSNAVECLSFSTQLSYHENTISSIVQQIGIADAQTFLSSSLYFVAIGSNDSFHYLKKNSPDHKYSPSEFDNLILSSLDHQLTRLYNQGARKIIYFGVGSLGCIPSQRAQNNSGACNNELNGWVLQLNEALKTLVQDLNSRFSDAKMTFANPYDISHDFIENPSTYGFQVTTEACCGTGKLNAQIPCLPVIQPCSNRSNHVFWDPWHPTEAANMFIATSLLSGSSKAIGPWSIAQLANLV